jgi:hypothetical protein
MLDVECWILGEFLTKSKHSEERLLEAARRVSGSESTLQDSVGRGILLRASRLRRDKVAGEGSRDFGFWILA